MRVIFETPPAPITLNYRGKGQLYKGFGSLRVTLFDPGEEPPLIPGTKTPSANPRPLSAWRAEGGGRVVAIPGPSFRGAMSPIVVPESALANIPEDAKLSLSWGFKPGAP